MSTIHKVSRGDGIARIAWQYGFFPDTVWNHPPNAALKSLRQNSEILQPGDEVAVPDKEPKQESGPTDRRHRFRLYGIPVKFQVRLMWDDEPRAGLPYEFIIDGNRRVSGTTDAEGWIRVPLMPDAQTGRLIIDHGAEVYNLQLGYVDPLDSLTGIQSRLRNLGFFEGDSDGQASPALTSAIADFQRHYQLDVSGQIDDATRNALRQTFGS
jgi:hypothetical protein